METNIPNYMDQYYNAFEQNLALAWAQAHLADYLRTHPNSPFSETEKCFLDAIEGGLGVALKFRKLNA